MGILLLVLRRGWSFIVMSFLVFAIIFALNYEPIVDSYPQLLPIRNALNTTIPVIAAIIVGIFAQGIGLIYKLFENAITKHLEELNNVAKEFLSSINELEEDSGKPVYFSSSIPNIVDSHRLYLHVEAPLCSRYRDILSKYGGLLNDVGNHWASAGLVLGKLRRLCVSINEHNERVKHIERELEGELRRPIENKALSKLLGIKADYLHNFVRSILFSNIIPRIVDKK